MKRDMLLVYPAEAAVIRLSLQKGGKTIILTV